ncbi:hypothetical protein BDF21DRAFT_475493 [Thamnidium elegans]|nr:hypothetical protein BDF21DRAFT_475493 [Thamnidium elegans]
MQVYKMIALLKTYTFVEDSNDIKLQQRRGRKLQDIFPTHYQLEENNNVFLPPPLDYTCRERQSLERDFSHLFTKYHLQLIHSTYFGPQGLREGTLKSRPFHASFLHVILRDLASMTITNSYTTKIVLSRYMTSLENM